MNELTKTQMEQIQDLQDRINQSFAPINELGDVYKNIQFSPAVQNLQKITKDQQLLCQKLSQSCTFASELISPAISNLVIAQKTIKQMTSVLIPQIAKLQESYYKQYQEYKNEEFPEDLKDFTWLLPQDLMNDPESPLYSLPRLVRIYKRKENKIKLQKQIDKQIIGVVKQDNWVLLEILINRWEEKGTLFSAERIQIYRDCLKIIRRFGKQTSANVVLPTLIAQIEGLWLDLLKNKGVNIENYYHEERKKYGKITLKKQKKELFQLINDNDINEQVFFEILTGVLFCDSDKMSGDIDFRRHKIMHGRVSDYGDIASVIKAFFIIDYLSRIE